MGKSRKLRFYCVLNNEKLSGQLDGRQTCQTAREPLLRQTPYRRQTLSYVLAFTPLLCDVLRRTRRRRGERSASAHPHFVLDTHRDTRRENSNRETHEKEGRAHTKLDVCTECVCVCVCVCVCMLFSSLLCFS